jgi:hypothetical protein
MVVVVEIVTSKVQIISIKLSDSRINHQIYKIQRMTNTWTKCVIYTHYKLTCSVCVFHLQRSCLQTLQMHRNIYAMCRKRSWEYFPKFISLLSSHYSECLKAIQKNWSVWRGLVFGTWNCHTHTEYSGYCNTCICFLAKIALLKALCGKVYVAKFTCPAKNVIFFYETAVINIPSLKMQCLIECFGGTSL